MFEVVLELQVNGTVATCDDPPVALGSMPQQFLEQVLNEISYFLMSLA